MRNIKSFKVFINESISNVGKRDGIYIVKKSHGRNGMEDYDYEVIIGNKPNKVDNISDISK